MAYGSLWVIIGGNPQSSGQALEDLIDQAVAKVLTATVIRATVEDLLPPPPGAYGLSGLTVDSVRKSQFMRALENSGAGRVDLLETALSGIPPGHADYPAVLAFEAAPFVTPGDVLANFTQTALGLAAGDMTTIFTAAAAIVD